MAAGRWHPDANAQHGAGRVHDGLARKEDARVVLTISGVSGNAATRLESFVTTNGAFALRSAARGQRSVPASGEGTGPEEARGTPAPTPADRPRPSYPGAGLPPGLPD